MKRDEVKQLVEEGITQLQQALAAGKSTQLEQFLAVMARFPQYSFNNCLLIAMQMPDAEMVQGFHAWKKAGRWVKKGEKGIGIIAPLLYRTKEQSNEDEDDNPIRGFKVVHVYDVSQTEGEDLPEFAQVLGDPGHYIGQLEEAIRGHGIELVYEDIGSGAEGLSCNGKIVVQPDLPQAERFAVLSHEFAHELLHQKEGRLRATTKSIRETEAEAVAHVVCRAIGVDSTRHSADYIQLSDGDAELLYQSLDAIQKTAAVILQALLRHQ